MTTEFVNTLKPSGGDFALASDWPVVSACNQTASTTKVFSHSGITGAIANNDPVTGATSGATGNVVGVTTAGQIVLDGISGTFQSGEDIEVSATHTNYVNTTDAGDSVSMVLEGYGTCTDTSLVDIDGWPSSATNPVVFRAAEPSFQFVLDGNGAAIIVDTAYVTIEGLEIIRTGIDGDGTGILVSTAATALTVKDCVVRAGPIASNSSTIAGIHVTDGGGNVVVTLINVICIGWYNQSFPTSLAPSGVHVLYGHVTALNCTMINCATGFSCSATYEITATNCVALCNEYSPAYFVDFETDVIGVSGNISSDSTAPGAAPITSLTSADFESIPNENYRPTLDGALYRAGTDLSDTFTTDITGGTRYLFWDSGAYAYLPPEVVTGIEQGYEGVIVPASLLPVNRAAGVKPVGNVAIDLPFKSYYWLFGGPQDGHDIAGTLGRSVEAGQVDSVNKGGYRDFPATSSLDTQLAIDNSNSFTAVAKFRALADHADNTPILTTGTNQVLSGFLIQQRGQVPGGQWWLFVSNQTTYQYIVFEKADFPYAQWNTVAVQVDASTNTAYVAINGVVKSVTLDSAYDGVVGAEMRIHDYTNRNTSTIAHQYEMVGYFETSNIDIASLTRDPYQFLKPVF
jgi:hypothetical protein